MSRLFKPVTSVVIVGISRLVFSNHRTETLQLGSQFGFLRACGTVPAKLAFAGFRSTLYDALEDRKQAVRSKQTCCLPISG